MHRRLDERSLCDGASRRPASFAGDVAALVHPGLRRLSNEDAAYVSPTLGFALVADGLGGHPHGDVASHTAITTATRSLERRGGAGRRPLTTARRLRWAFQEADAEVRAQPSTAGQPRMGTTLVALAVGEDHVAVAHAGDSRCYRVRSGSVERLTRDHTLIERRPTLPAECDGRLLTACVGGGTALAVDVATYPVRAGDVFLLCSDGLWEAVSELSMARLARRSESAAAACRRLVRAACAAGGHDNVGVAVVRVPTFRASAGARC